MAEPMSMSEIEISGWKDFFEEVASLAALSERQYGIGNRDFADYMIERLDLCTSTSSAIYDHICSSEAIQLQDSIAELIRCLKKMQEDWHSYSTSLDGVPQRSVACIQCGQQGRPRFVVDKSQIEYLESLSFKWTEIASISRMTLYRLVAFPELV